MESPNKLKLLVQKLPNRFGYAERVLNSLNLAINSNNKQKVYNVVNGLSYDSDIVESLLKITDEYLTLQDELESRIDTLLNRFEDAEISSID